jgi:hypothetical protein
VQNELQLLDQGLNAKTIQKLGLSAASIGQTTPGQ